MSERLSAAQQRHTERHRTSPRWRAPAQHKRTTRAQQLAASRDDPAATGTHLQNRQRPLRRFPHAPRDRHRRVHERKRRQLSRHHNPLRHRRRCRSFERKHGRTHTQSHDGQHNQPSSHPNTATTQQAAPHPSHQTQPSAMCLPSALVLERERAAGHRLGHQSGLRASAATRPQRTRTRGPERILLLVWEPSGTNLSLVPNDPRSHVKSGSFAALPSRASDADGPAATGVLGDVGVCKSALSHPGGRGFESP